MGLDMYLNRRVYIGGNYEHRKVGGTVNLQLNGKPILIPGTRVSEILLHEGYWRKANAIHAWFVTNCADGRDECQQIEVTKDQLLELRDLCEQVLHSPEEAPELLPSQSGFFFGSTEYDEGYYQDLRDTIDIITRALAEDFNHDYFVYCASW